MIKRDLSNKVLMVGVYYKNYAPGGMAAVVATYSEHFENLRYLSSWKWSNIFVKTFYAIKSIIQFYVLLLIDKRIEIVHIHGATNASFYRKKIFIDIAYFFKKKIIYHIHGADFDEFYSKNKNKSKIIKTIDKCNKLIVLSNSWQMFFISIGISEEKIVILNNIVSLPVSFDDKLATKEIFFLFLGEIGERKGVFDLLNVIIENKKYFKNKIRVRIGGNGQVEKLKRIIFENDLSGIVNYLGWVNGSEKNKELYNCDVFILPSYNEGLPISILEAMSYSCPVISTPVGGIPEIIKSNENGILVEPGNLKQIKNSLMYFIDNPTDVSSFGAKSKEIVTSYYPENVIQNLEIIYNDLISNK